MGRVSQAERIVAACLIVGAPLVAGCRGCGEGPSEQAPGRPPRSAAEGAVGDRDVRRLFDIVSRCDIEHRGVLVDFGTPMLGGRTRATLPTTERDGATWSVVSERSTEVRFLQAEAKQVFVSARIAPGTARSVSFHVDDVLLGTLRLKGDEARVVTTPTTTLALDPGEHVVTMRFTPPRVREPYAEVDWIRVGTPDDMTATFGAPTLDDVLAPTAVLAKVPHRAFSLPTPATIRCPLRVPSGARFRTAVGMIGAGEAEAEIAVRVDGEPLLALSRTKVKGGDAAAWQDLDLSLDAFAGKLVHLELRTPPAERPVRVLFGDPEISVPTVEPRATPPAQVVVVVVLSGVARDELPGYGPKPPAHLERLRKLTERAVVFRDHRGPTTVVPATLATLLTALPPESHTLTDYGARLPAGISTLAEAARSAGVRVGWFTASPYSFPAFGFGAGATDLQALSPVSGEGRDAVTLATEWLRKSLDPTQDVRTLLFVHARGGHPPWTLDPKLIDGLAPANYSGEISPRKAAQQLAAIRGRRALHELPEADRVRLEGLHQLALAEHDRALGVLLDVLDDASIADRTLVVVTTDGSTSLSQLFTQRPPLDERNLLTPLYVLFPSAAHGGREISEPTEVVDVARTLYQALDLRPRGSFGRSLHAIAAGLAYSDDEPQVAAEGDARSTKWGRFVLRESDGATRGRVCDLLVDPTCAFDRRSQVPFAAAALERAAAAHGRAAQGLAVKREPATIDDETLAALRVWGAME